MRIRGQPAQHLGKSLDSLVESLGDRLVIPRGALVSAMSAPSSRLIAEDLTLVSEGQSDIPSRRGALSGRASCERAVTQPLQFGIEQFQEGGARRQRIVD
jgi:hypothetical protein